MANTEESNIYELSYLILPSIPEDKVGEVVLAIKGIVAKVGGTEIDGEAPFKQDLAYQMSKTVGSSKYVVNDAYLGWLKFELEVAKIDEVKSAVEKMPEVLRSLVIKATRETIFTFAKAPDALLAVEEAEKWGKEPAPAPEEVVVQ